MAKKNYTLKTSREAAEIYMTVEFGAARAAKELADQPGRGLFTLSCLDGLVNNPPMRCGIRRKEYAEGWAKRASVMIAWEQGRRGLDERASVTVVAIDYPLWRRITNPPCSVRWRQSAARALG